MAGLALLAILALALPVGAAAVKKPARAKCSAAKAKAGAPGFSRAAKRCKRKRKHSQVNPSATQPQSATPSASSDTRETTLPNFQPAPQPGCSLATPGSPVGMSLPGCNLIASDTASAPDPIPFWGSADCADATRHQQLVSGGDPHATATGSVQGDSAYRQMTVFDGDDFYGERCELGLNDHRYGPTAFYREGNRRVTYLSARLPDNLQMDRLLWQVVMQMKQTQPSADIGTPVIELDAYDGRWVLLHSTSNHSDPTFGSEELWSVPAQHNKWTRFAFDVNYSTSASNGSIKVYIDSNADGDFSDAGEASPTFHTYTLKYEPASANPPDGALPPGSPIPSHLRAGPYHSTDYDCPAPTGCSVGIDNVQVVAP
jgi:polysaccharide lyase-like protein